MFNLNLDLQLNENFRRGIIQNFKFLYKRHNDLLAMITRHKLTDEVAHTTDQIKQGGRNQLNINDDLQSQIDALAVAPRDNSANEIVEARVDILGTQYPTLKRHLIAWEERTKIMKDEVMKAVNDAVEHIYDIEYRFDPENQEFLYVTDLSPLTNAVMQSSWIDNRTGIIYMTQAHSSYKITRLKPNGAYIDEMIVEGGGHGTHNGYRYIDNKLWIYSHITNSEGASSIVRFTYHPHVKMPYGTYDMEEVFTGHPEKPYITPTINQQTDEILYRIQYPREEWDKRNSMNYIEIRKLEDVDNRIDNVVDRFDIPLRLTGNERPMQGVAFDEENVYWYTGSSNPLSDNMIAIFDRKTGKIKSEFIVDYGGVNGEYAGDFQEPEGLQIYYNKDGKKALILGVVIGGAGNRTHKLYTVAQRGVLDELKSRGTPVPLTDTGGRVKPLPVDPLKMRNLRDIIEPGYYYLYTAHTRNLDDFPEGVPKDAGWFLEVKPPQSNGDVLQVLRRNSYGRNILTFERFVSGIKDRNGVSPWNLVYKTAGYWERIPSDFTKMEDMNMVGMTYYITAAETNMLKGFPKERAGYAGWVVHVEQSDSQNSFMQRLVRNNTIAPTEILYRNYRSSGATSWYIFRGEEIK